MILTAALMHGLGAGFGAWRVREGQAGDYRSSSFYREIATLGEAGKLHALFLAEQMTNRDTGTDRPCGAPDTATALSHMAAVTSRIGLVGTASTTYNQPHEVARCFATLDHLSGGRAVTVWTHPAATRTSPGRRPDRGAAPGGCRPDGERVGQPKTLSS